MAGTHCWLPTEPKLTTGRAVILVKAMSLRAMFSLIVLLAFAGLAGRAVAADPVAELASFSVFKNIDLAKLASGNVLAARGPTMNFPRGLAIESCYVVQAPL